MTKQRELPGASPQWHAAHPDAIASGGQIVNFAEGWATNIMGPSMTAHYFRRTSQSSSVIADQMDEAQTLCGYVAPVRVLFGPGNLPRCLRCQQRWQKTAFRGAS